MSLPQGKTPVWNRIKTISFAPPCSVFCSTLLHVLLHLAPRFDPLCSAFCSPLLRILILLLRILIPSLRVLIHTTPPLLHNSFSPQPEINGHQVLQSEGTTHKLRPCPSSFRHAPTLRHSIQLHIPLLSSDIFDISGFFSFYLYTCTMKTGSQAFGKCFLFSFYYSNTVIIYCTISIDSASHASQGLWSGPNFGQCHMSLWLWSHVRNGSKKQL